MMMGFDGYSFCKPHSASYTLVAYKSAYLRAHYPAEFMASVISNGGGYYSTFGYVSEARRMGLTILLPDVNRSDIKYIGKDKDIRIGLMQIRDMTLEAKETIIQERKKNGPYGSLQEFLDRTVSQVHLQDVKALIKAGCFDSISRSITRPGLMWQALSFFHQKEEDKTPTLFDQVKTPVPSQGPSSLKEPYSDALMRKHEIETLGFYFSIHPLDLYRRKLSGMDYVPAKDLALHVGETVTTIGWQVTGKTIRTKTGETMKFVSFEDTTGLYETVFFPKIYNRYCHLLNAAKPYLIKGKVEEDFGALCLTVNWIGFAGTMGLIRINNGFC